MKEETIVDVHIEQNAPEEKISDKTVVSDVLPFVPIFEHKQSVRNADSTQKITTENDLKLKDYTFDLLSDYGPSRLWKKHTDMLECMMMPPTLQELSAETENPLCWNTNEVFSYINRIPKCHGPAKIFLEQDINGPALLSLAHEDLTCVLKFRNGPSAKIYNQIVCLRHRASSMALKQ